jgi:dipeptidyl aminopeptidase/acylaminoacyl peptidase
MEPIAAQRCIGGIDLTEPRLADDGSLLAYAHSAAGVAHLEVHRFDDSPGFQLAVAPALRPGRGLGGGAWTFSADGEFIVYVAVDGNLWRQALGGGPAVSLTDHGPDRSASGPVASADGREIFYVLDLAEVHVLEMSSGTSRRVDDGNGDFCMDPFVDASGRVSWMSWNVPDMAWDASRTRRALRGVVADDVASGFCVQQPRVLPSGLPISVRDDHGWLNVWIGDEPLVHEPCEHAGPSWGPGQRSYDWSPDGRFVAFARNEGGFGRLCIVDVETRAVREVARGVHGQLSWQGHRLSAVRTGARTPTQVVVYETNSWARTVVAVGSSTDWSPEELVEPELVEVPVTVPVTDGVLHARLYRAPNANGRMIVWLHGGPTDQWMVTFMPRVSYWLSRGWTILMPDHRGSTGHGRAYQQALRGRWGELDVADTLAVTEYALAAGWADRDRTVVFGSSAGGFTALGAVAAAPECFAAAVLLYPVSDLIELAERSHRFERHYTDSLVGPLPADVAVYRERSPGYHASRFMGTPLLIMHGELDAVVPVRQSRVFAQRVRTAGGDAQVHVYPNEGHGFRQPENQLDEYRRAEDFLARCVPVASRG